VGDATQVPESSVLISGPSAATPLFYGSFEEELDFAINAPQVFLGQIVDLSPKS
jgi:hypothetical protein